MTVSPDIIGPLFDGNDAESYRRAIIRGVERQKADGQFKPGYCEGNELFERWIRGYNESEEDDSTPWLFE